MIADFSVSNEELYQTVVDSGTLTIATWDHNHIEGRFAFTAWEAFVDAPREVKVRRHVLVRMRGDDHRLLTGRLRRLAIV